MADNRISKVNVNYLTVNKRLELVSIAIAPHLELHMPNSIHEYAKTTSQLKNRQPS